MPNKSIHFFLLQDRFFSSDDDFHLEQVCMHFGKALGQFVSRCSLCTTVYDAYHGSLLNNSFLDTEYYSSYFHACVVDCIVIFDKHIRNFLNFLYEYYGFVSTDSMFLYQNYWSQ